MRDEMDARIWDAHRKDYAEAVDALLTKVRGAFVRLQSWDGSFSHLAALALSLVLTGVTFKATVI